MMLVAVVLVGIKPKERSPALIKALDIKKAVGGNFQVFLVVVMVLLLARSAKAAPFRGERRFY